MHCAQLDTKFFQDKKVLVTGHTGFKGTWLTVWLKRLGAKVTGIALPPTTQPSLFELTRVVNVVDNNFCDIRDTLKLNEIVRKSQPEVVIHLAAQPLVRRGYRQPLDTFSCNIMGTACLLEALRGCEALRVVLIITTDKVYENYEWPYPYREIDTLGGKDPYSASKACAEIVTNAYRNSFFDPKTPIASARAGNVIGGGDWSEERLIPDAIRAWQAGQPLEIRYPNAIRPWQHVLEPLAGYLILAQKLWKSPQYAGAYNFGPDGREVITVCDLIEAARKSYGFGEVLVKDTPNEISEAHFLALDTGKARRLLGISQKWSLSETIDRTIKWYRSQYSGKDALLLCEEDIDNYEKSQCF